jgi:hypothetical protein
MAEKTDANPAETTNSLTIVPVPVERWFEFEFESGNNSTERNIQILESDFKGKVAIFKYSQLSKLSPAEINGLKQELVKTFTKIFDVETFNQLPPHIVEHINPQSPKNALDHEYDHLKGIVNEEERNGSFFVISLVQTEDGKKHLAGLALGTTSETDPYEFCLSLLNPRYLSPGDIATYRNILFELTLDGRNEEADRLAKIYKTKIIEENFMK